MNRSLIAPAFLMAFTVVALAQDSSSRSSNSRERSSQRDSDRDRNNSSRRDRDSRRNNGGFPLTAIRSIDGSDNSAGGEAGTTLGRAADADYPGDGSGATIKEPPDVPNARTISNTVAAQSDVIFNNRKLSDLVWAWGQFLDHDIDLTETSADNGTADISIDDANDPLAPGPIPLDRSNFDPATGTADNPRQQLNEITAYIDASNVYGSNAERAAALRSFVDGKLATSDGDLLPFNEFGLPNAGGPSPLLFLAGDIRANEQIGLTALHTLFVREHNRLAERIVEKYPDATDEEVYQLARKIVGAEMQIITYKEFLPALLGPMAPTLKNYNGFRDRVNPGIVNEFSTAAYRFGHSMLSPFLVLADTNGPMDAIALRDAFFNPTLLVNNPENIDYLLNGFTYQTAQEIDNRVIDDVRNFLFGSPGAGGFDLASLNIQRGRDHGLPSYNAIRAAYGLQTADGFDDISSDPQVQADLASLYDSPDDVDAWIGGLAEDHVPGASVGGLVGIVLAEQFTRLRDGDRFFYLNDPDLKGKELESIIDLKNLRLSRVIRRNTAIDEIPRNVFFITD